MSISRPPRNPTKALRLLFSCRYRVLFRTKVSGNIAKASPSKPLMCVATIASTEDTLYGCLWSAPYRVLVYDSALSPCDWHAITLSPLSADPKKIKPRSSLGSMSSATFGSSSNGHSSASLAAAMVVQVCLQTSLTHVLSVQHCHKNGAAAVSHATKRYSSIVKPTDISFE